MRNITVLVYLLILSYICVSCAIITGTIPEFELKGYIKYENGTPVSFTPILFKTTTENLLGYTDQQGRFIISITESGTLHIDANKNKPIYENITSKINFIKDKRILEIDGKIYKPNDEVSIVVPYNELGRMMKPSFEAIIACNAQGNSECVLNKGKDYIKKYIHIADRQWEETQRLVKENASKVEKEEARKRKYEYIMSLNNETDYKAIISGGEEYIKQYRNANDSKWEEVEKYVNDAYAVVEREEMEKRVNEAVKKRKKEFQYIMQIDKAHYEAIIDYGKEYIKKYRNINDSNWEDIEKRVNAAVFLAIKNLNINKDYDSILSQGKEYIEKYSNIKDSQWEEIVNLVNKAEQRKKQVEEEKRERLARCNNEILTQREFLMGKNPYADEGKCVEFMAGTFQMTSANAGLFHIGNNELAYIEFNKTFRGVYVKGIAKIKGIYEYISRIGTLNQVPHLEMLEIEEIRE